MADDVKKSLKNFTPMEGVLLMIGFVLVSVIFAAFVHMVSDYPDRIALPTLSIAGIVLLLICLTGVSYVFARAGLQNNAEALGLPSGSIQSVIALSLIVLFAILSVFLFSSIGGSSSFRELRNLSAADRNDQMSRLGPNFAGWQQQGETDKFTIYVRDPGIDARNDVGKQLIVLIGTLMTSAVSFYFGSRATASGAAAVSGGGADRTVVAPAPQTPPVPEAPESPEPPPGPAAAAISTIEPGGAIAKERTTAVTLSGSGLAGATGVVVRQGEVALRVGALSVSENQIGFTLAPPGSVPPGAYDVTVVANGAELVTRAGALTVSGP